MWQWRKLHNEELNDLYTSSIFVWVLKSRRKRRPGYVTRVEERRGIYRVLAEKSEEKRPLGRPRHRWEVYIKIDLQEVGYGAWIWLSCL